MGKPCDVAISFLNIDETLAVKLQTELSEVLDVFVYTQRQQELVGTDGFESCRSLFLADCKLIVVLYRDGWGGKGWTGIEEKAIQDRMLSQGWESLLFVMLEKQGTPPKWVPAGPLRLNYADYENDLTGAIKERAQTLGSTLKTETALERLTRADAKAQERRKRTEMLETSGSAEIAREYGQLIQQLTDKITELDSRGSSIKLSAGSAGGEFLVRTQEVNTGVTLERRHVIDQAQLVLREFDRSRFLPAERKMHFPGYEPREISRSEFFFDYQPTHGWCWRTGKGAQEHFVNTFAVSENILRRLIDLHEEFASGKRTRTRSDESSYGGSPWS